MEFLNHLKEAKSHAFGFISCLLLVALFTSLLQTPLLYFANEMGIPLTRLSLLQEGMDKNLFLSLSLLPFSGILFAIYLCIKKIHKMDFKGLISTDGHLDLKRLGFGFSLWFILSFLSFFLDYSIHEDQYVFQFEWVNFLPLLIISLLLIPIQTSSEEILVRSYLMQILGVATNKRWVPIVTTSTLFGLLHLANPEMDHFGALTILPMYIGSGILFAICTVLDDRLELALGMHAANNVFIALFVTNQNSVFQTHALFEAPQDDLVLNYISWALGSVLFLVIANRKYKWQNWRYLIQEKS